jgi:hypothetical protein
MGAPEMHSDLYREHMTGDPAYDKAFAALADCPSFAEVERTLKTYAHELAEKQRGYAEEEWSGGDARMILRRRIARHLTDLIDPEVSTDG